MSIRLRHATYFLCSLGLGLLPLHARANGLIGTSVTGGLFFSGGTTNFYDPANGYVPTSGYENTSGTTVSIASPAVEFGFADSGNTDFANFSATQFTIEDVLASTAGGTDNPFTMTFIDTAFTGLGFQQATNSFPGTLTASLVGDKVTISWTGSTVHANDDYTSTFVMATVPEPATWPAAGLAAGALALVLWRRRAARA